MEAFRTFTNVLHHYHGQGLQELRAASASDDKTVN
jgi:hypothetical protein